MKNFPLLRCFFAFALLATPSATVFADEETESTLTKVGDAAPTFVTTTFDGAQFDLAGLRGKVVVLDFFATWCGPCVEAMPELEKKVWQPFKDNGKLALVGIGREHETAEMEPFQKKLNITFPLAADPKREAYAKYASKFIPRTYVIDAEGKIVFQSVGYSQEEFGKMVEVIKAELAKVGN